MIDPLVSLAFSLQANRGAYALLIGSGVSRSAGIPTGWEITLELVKKLAAASGSELKSTAEDWFRDTYGREPDYSDLLDQLCKSAAERQQYLKGFFEPNDNEREQGLKAPTSAHHAIAELMAEGYVRVIITTNFDRLLEQALEARGVVPVVVSNADQIKGMLPLVHQKHCIVKVHGDYLDTRIMNTGAELAEYAPEMDRLLDQLFDEFGFILCGWSGAWDTALRNAISRAPSRRFSSYWAVKEALGDEGQKLAENRGIISISIETADGFFTKLSENLASLREYDRPHPVSVQSAVASVKRYLAEDRYRIRLHDLLMAVVQDTQQQWKKSGIEMNSPKPDDASIVARVKSYDASMEFLLPIGRELGMWAHSDQFQMISELIKLLTEEKTSEHSYYPLWRGLSLYPGTQFLYAVGLGALKAGNLELIERMFSLDIRTQNGHHQPAVAVLAPIFLCEDKRSLWPLFSGAHPLTPLNTWLEANMRALFAPGSNSDAYNDRFTATFDEFEILAAIAYRALIRKQDERLWVPFGCWGWRCRHDMGHFDRLRSDLENNGAKSKIMRIGVFREDESEAQTVLSEVTDFASRLTLF